MRDFTRDLRFAARGVLRRPGHSLAIVATLAVGIGANTAIFSVFNWILFRPLPAVSRPSELVTIKYRHPKSAGNFWVSYRDYADLRDRVSAFTALAGSVPLKADLSLPGREAQRSDVEVVTANYFPMLGVAAAPGRAFLASEERSG